MKLGEDLMVKLNIGSGFMSPEVVFATDKDWVNVDINYDSNLAEWKNANYIKFELSEYWPIAYESADCIFASHIFEHIEYNKLLQTCAQCFRALKIDSPMRIICPDPRIFIKKYHEKDMQFLVDCFGQDNFLLHEYKTFTNMAFTDMFFGEHYAHALCSSIDLLSIMLIRAGFRKVVERNFGETDYPQFFSNLDNRKNMSFYLEVTK